MNPGQTVFLVDDQPAVLKGLSRLLASAGFAVAAFESAQAFLDSGRDSEAGCLLLDLSMPGMDGVALQQALVAADCALPLIFLTGHGDIDSGVRAMKLGAFDFLTKPVEGERLIEVVQRALERNVQLRQHTAQRNESRRRLATLTPREREVLDMVIEGRLNKQIAADLGTVEKTIKVHRARVMAKMDVRSVTALVRLVDQANKDGPAEP